MDMNSSNNVRHIGATSSHFLEKTQKNNNMQTLVSQLINKAEGKDKEKLITAAEKAVKQLNKVMKNTAKDLRFHLFVDGTDLAYVEVIDPKTKKVIRQVPPEQLIEALLRIHDAIGVILDKYI